jgi:hypothetical protein
VRRKRRQAAALQIIDLAPHPRVSIFEPTNGHHFVAAWIDDFDCNPAMFAGSEWKRDRPLECFECFRISRALERLRNLLPCILVRKKRLRDAEAATIVVRVEKPRGYLLRASRANRVLYRVVDVDTLQLAYPLVVAILADSTSG